jgi:hypothetical protein
VGVIGKENQNLPQNMSIYAISFYEFERKVGYWVFQNEEERDRVFDAIRNQFSKEISLSKQSEPVRQTAFLR